MNMCCETCACKVGCHLYATHNDDEAVCVRYVANEESEDEERPSD